MAEPTQDDLPPLGRPTPARRGSTRKEGLGSTLLVAVIALAVGLVVGIPVGQAIDDESEERASPGTPGNEVDESDPPTSTTVAAVPQECVETIRAAQQALVLLDEGLQSLGRLDLLEVETVLADMQRLREGFARRAQECLEGSRQAPDG